MASVLETMSLAEIRNHLASREGEAKRILQRIEKKKEEITELELQYSQLMGQNGTVTARPKNEKSLNIHIHETLKKHKKGLTLGEIAEVVQAAGYQSNAANFKNVLYQNLYNNDNIERDENTGKYSLVSAANQA